MSRVKNPQDKKRLAYEHERRNASGQPPKGWRNTKPLKKAKARRAFRKATNDTLASTLQDDSPSLSASRRAGSVLQEKIIDWGRVKLGSYVQMRLKHRRANVGARKMRRAGQGDDEA